MSTLTHRLRAAFQASADVRYSPGFVDSVTFWSRVTGRVCQIGDAKRLPGAAAAAPACAARAAGESLPTSLSPRSTTTSEDFRPHALDPARQPAASTVSTRCPVKRNFVGAELVIGDLETHSKGPLR